MIHEDNDQLKIISSCPVCANKKFPEQIRVLSEKSSAHVLYVQCQQCRSKMVVYVNFSPTGVNTTGFLTDLSGDEVVEFSSGAPVTTDDVLEVYKFIKRKKKGIQNYEMIQMTT